MVLSVATKVTEDSFEGQSFQYFADLVEEYSNGSLKLDIYPSEQLGDSATVVTNLQLGTVDMYIEGVSFYSSYGVDTGFVNYPFLMADWETYHDLVTGDFGKTQAEQMEQAGFKLLSTERNWIRGPYYVACTTKPINSMSDLQALRLRSHESSTFMDALSYLDINTFVLAYSETYMGIKQGTVDGVICPVSNVEDMAFHEVAPYITYMNVYPNEIWPVMNLDKFNSLSQEQQDALIRAVNDAAQHSDEQLEAYVDEMLVRIEAEGAIENMDFDCSEFVEALSDYYKGVAADGGLPQQVAEYFGLL